MNGIYDFHVGGAFPVYRKREKRPYANSIWLFLDKHRICWRVTMNKSDVNSRSGCNMNNIAMTSAKNTSTSPGAEAAGAPPLPPICESSCWHIETEHHGFERDRAEVAVRAITRAERDRIEAAAAAVWDAAIARSEAVIEITGATGRDASDTNGLFDRVPAERAPGGPPVYRLRSRSDENAMWIYLARNNRWCVGSASEKEWGDDWGAARNPDAVADGTLPHEAPARHRSAEHDFSLNGNVVM